MANAANKSSDQIGIPYPVAARSVLVLRASGYSGEPIELCAYAPDTFTQVDRICCEIAIEWGAITAESMLSFAKEIKRRLEL